MYKTKITENHVSEQNIQYDGKNSNLFRISRLLNIKKLFSGKFRLC